MRLEPWETGSVDLRCPRTEGGQGLLGQVDGRSSAAVLRWLTQRDQAFRDAVEIVALDPSAPYAAAVRAALPAARVAVDHFHLVALANQALTAVRQRVTPRTARPPRPPARPGLGQPATAAARPRTALEQGDGADVERRDRPRTHRPTTSPALSPGLAWCRCLNDERCS